MPDEVYALLEKVTDERTFNIFLTALLEDCRSHQECRGRYFDCAQQGHWETASTKDFLASVHDWATGGDFAGGVHHGEPLLRRFATMLYVGRHLRPEDRPYDR